MSHHFIRKEHKTSEVLTDTKWFNKCPTLGWVHLCRWQKKRIMVQLLQPVQYAVFRFNVSYNGFVQLCNDQGTRPAALYNNANANSLHGVWIWHSSDTESRGTAAALWLAVVAPISVFLLSDRLFHIKEKCPKLILAIDIHFLSEPPSRFQSILNFYSI